MLHEGLVAAFVAVVDALDGGRVERRPAYLLLMCPHLAQIPQANGVWGDGADAQAAAELARAVADFDRLGLRFWLQTRQGRHPALEAEATKIGLRHVDDVPAFVAAPDDLATLPDAELEIRRVEGEPGLTQALSVAAAGFEVAVPALAAFYTPEVASIPGLSIYLGSIDGTPVSTAVGYVAREGVGVFNVATPPQHRRRGFGAALTARAVADGFSAGARLAWLQSSAAGESVYRRMGFRQVEAYRLFTRAT